MTTLREILIIGGQNMIVRALATQLIAQEWEVERIPSVDVAKRYLSESAFAMVFISMEEIPNAVEGIRELVFLFRGLPVVAMATAGNVHEAREAIAVGAADYILLPVSEDMIQEMTTRFANQAFDPELGRGKKFITADQGMKRLLNQVRRVASSRATVLIQGESGTGKELIARYIHQVSDRVAAPFIAVNCAALPENLLESELFGHAKGAFTGAISDRKGKFQQAHGGTLFLDEISEMELNLQAKLLRVIQEGEVDPIGGRSPIAIDVRILASTNRDLKEWVGQGHFREDLFYRLNVFPLRLPPLRERSGDIPLIADHFRKRFIHELQRNDIRFSPDAIRMLTRYSWPGNIRELENVVHRALLVAEDLAIGTMDLMIDVGQELPSETTSPVAERDLPIGTTVREMEELLIRRTLDEVKGNRTQAARLLGISIRTLRNKLNEYAGRF